MDKEGELIIWGYDAFEIYETHEGESPDYEGGLATYKLPREPASYLKPGEKLGI